MLYIVSHILYVRIKMLLLRLSNELRLFSINIKNLSNKYTLIYKNKINKIYIVELKC